MEITIGVLIPFICTTLGSAAVFLFRDKVNDKILSAFLAFAAGIMVSASIFSLILPAMDSAEELGMIPWIPVCISFMLGGLFLLLVDRVVPHLHPQSNTTEGLPSKLKRTTMLVFAVTLHNVPEGMAVGLMFGLALQTKDPAAISAAFALAIGIGIQNIPEGAAVALPMKKEGLSNPKAFIYGTLSGLVEPIAAVIAIFFVSIVDGMMPWLLAFSAGAMIYVVVEELIPEAHMDEHSHIATMVFMVGFTIMMVLDIALG